MLNQSIHDLQQQIKARKISPSELAQASLAAAKQHNPALNCFISLTEELATVQATAAMSDTTVLAGIPMAFKDNFNVIGSRTTCASKMLENYVSPYHASVVEKALSAGAICIGKTNMDEFAMGSTNENSYFGAVHNPFNLAHASGGSSGGSAAAVAAGIVPIALGSDTGGSVRQPAAFCGVTGLKPTYGRISRYGVVAFASSLDQVGIFTRRASDCALSLQMLAGYDHKDSTSVNQAVPDYSAELTAPLAGKKIGLVRHLFDKITDTSLQTVFNTALDEYQKRGVQFVDIDLPDPELCVAAYYVLSSCECSSNLSRFDGVRYGHRSEQTQDLDSLYTLSRTEGFGAEVKRRILLGTFALSSGFYDAYYSKAQKMRRAVLNHLQNTFTQVDAILLPTSIITAPKIGQEFDYNDDMCTITANLAGLPALSHPIGLHQGLPVGLQIIGPHFAEGAILNIAHQYQQHNDHHLLIPDWAK